MSRLLSTAIRRSPQVRFQLSFLTAIIGLGLFAAFGEFPA